MQKRASWLAAFAIALALAGCAGSDGAQGPQGAKGDQGDTGVGLPGADGKDLTATAQPESCAVCHSGSGGYHQAVYDQYTDKTVFTVSIDSVETVSSVATMLVTIKKDGQPFIDTADGLGTFDQKRFYAAKYDPTTGTFNANLEFKFPEMVVDGQYAVTAVVGTWAPEASNAIAYAYLADNVLATEFSAPSEFPIYSDVVNVGTTFGTMDYASAANVSGCEKCHGKPYLKHGYRGAEATNLPDFAACKACHYDTRNGGHEMWQILVDDPLFAATTGTTALTAAVKAKYAYKATVMNDTHMSHAMEFAYPQSMANCVTCHEGKLGVILDNSNFTVATCRSCHPVTGPSQAKYLDGKRAPALKTLMTPIANHSAALLGNLYGAPTCTGCHDGSTARTFGEMHSGRDTAIYAADGRRYSDVFQVTIDSATKAGNVLTFNYSATEIGDDPINLASIAPRILVGLYGYDTKDFIVDPSTRVNNLRNLDWTPPETHRRFTITSPAANTWQVTVDLSDWASMIGSVVKRAEIAVLPTLKDAAGTTVALKAPSRTFDLVNGTFVAAAPAIVSVDKCNKCHDALATTFHSGNRSGNIVACRLCHNTRNGGGHLEMQSRSIDSYAHAIHSMQPFDIGDVDFLDTVEKMRYEHHVESHYPNFTILNCESCHNPGTYDVPSQANSLPGTLSAAAVTNDEDRTIGAISSKVTGPAARACGGCHRTHAINENNAAKLVAVNQHMGTFGYLLEATTGVLDAAIAKIMALFQ